MIDCVQGAKVVLKKNDVVVAEMLTDNYGDYKLDYIKPDSGVYRLDVTYKDFEIKTITIEVTKSMSLKDIVFE